ncbi:hypothetical protein K1719_001047 [Acacia pycnantha]|nr:hypothetical protein K1719_001047 [Acacia pycnantha]
MKGSFVVQDAYVFKVETHVTILKTSLFFSGEGFTVYNSHGQLSTCMTKLPSKKKRTSMQKKTSVEEAVQEYEDNRFGLHKHGSGHDEHTSGSQ